MGVLCFSPAPKHRYKVEDLLRLLSKYLEIESRTVRKGPVLEEELRSLKFLYKSAKVHARLAGGPPSALGGKRNRVAISSPADGGRVELSWIGEVNEGEPSGWREAKRQKTVGPLTTSIPLPSADSQARTWAHLHTNTNMERYSDGPIPLPPPGQIAGPNHVANHELLQNDDTHAPRHEPAAASVTNLMLQAHLVGQQQYTAHQYNNIPFNLQGTIADFSSGDHHQMSFTDVGGVSTIHSQIDSYRLQPPTHGVGNSSSFSTHPHPGQSTMMAHGASSSTNGLSHPFTTQPPHTHVSQSQLQAQTQGQTTETDLSSEEYYALSAAIAYQPTQPPITQVLSRVNLAAAHVTQTTPDNPSIELPQMNGIHGLSCLGHAHDQGPMVSGHPHQQQHQPDPGHDDRRVQAGVEGPSDMSMDMIEVGDGWGTHLGPASDQNRHQQSHLQHQHQQSPGLGFTESEVNGSSVPTGSTLI